MLFCFLDRCTASERQPSSKWESPPPTPTGSIYSDSWNFGSQLVKPLWSANDLQQQDNCRLSQTCLLFSHYHLIVYMCCWYQSSEIMILCDIHWKIPNSAVTVITTSSYSTACTYHPKTHFRQTMCFVRIKKLKVKQTPHHEMTHTRAPRHGSFCEREPYSLLQCSLQAPARWRSTRHLLLTKCTTCLLTARRFSPDATKRRDSK